MVENHQIPSILHIKQRMAQLFFTNVSKNHCSASGVAGCSLECRSVLRTHLLCLFTCPGRLLAPVRTRGAGDRVQTITIDCTRWAELLLYRQSESVWSSSLSRRWSDATTVLDDSCFGCRLQPLCQNALYFVVAWFVFPVGCRLVAITCLKKYSCRTCRHVPLLR